MHPVVQSILLRGPGKGEGTGLQISSRGRGKNKGDVPREVMGTSLALNKLLLSDSQAKTFIVIAPIATERHREGSSAGKGWLATAFCRNSTG